MNLFSRILAFSFLLGLSHQLVGLYKEKRDQSLKKAHDFKQETRQLLKNQDGALFMLGLVVTQFLIAALVHWILIDLQCKARIELRRKTYLCTQNLLKREKRYLSRMAYFNTAIKAAFLAQFIPQTSAAAQSSLKALKLAQDLYHNGRFINLTDNHCPRAISLYWAWNTPYKTVGKIKLKRGIDGTARLKNKEWKRWITLNGQGKYKDLIPKKYWFSINFKMKAQSQFDNNPKITVKELAIEDLLNWKWYFGRLLSWRSA